jgi:L-malate glycosyltransferase
LHVLLLCGSMIRMRRHRLVLNFHGDDLLPTTLRGKVLQKIVRPHYKLAALVLVPSRYFKSEFIKRFGGGGPEVKVFRSGGVADLYFEQPHRTPEQRGLSILYLSRLVSGKGWRDFLDVAERLHAIDDRLAAVLAGDGIDRPEVEALVRERGLSRFVRVYGASDQISNRELYSSHKYFIFPTRYQESLALVNLEAMACGSIVLSSDFPALDDYLIHGEEGFRIDRTSFVQACVDTIVKLEAGESDLGTIAGKAHARAELYRESRVISGLPEILGLSANA